MEDKLLNVNEVAEYLNVKKLTIYDWVHHERISYIKIHGCLRFRKDLIDMWIENSVHLSLKMKILYNKHSRVSSGETK